MITKRRNEIPFNINYNVKVKLTKKGRSLAKYLPKEDDDGYTTWQLWVLMNEFGEHMIIGLDVPFETNIILIPED